MDITSELDQEGDRWKDESCGVEFVAQYIRSHFNRFIVSFFKSGIRLLIDVQIRLYGTWINFYVYVPRTYEHRTLGFLGNIDGDRLNDFRTRNNAVISIPFGNSFYDVVFDHLEEHCK